MSIDRSNLSRSHSMSDLSSVQKVDQKPQLKRTQSAPNIGKMPTGQKVEMLHSTEITPRKEVSENSHESQTGTVTSEKQITSQIKADKNTEMKQTAGKINKLAVGGVIGGVALTAGGVGLFALGMVAFIFLLPSGPLAIAAAVALAAAGAGLIGAGAGISGVSMAFLTKSDEQSTQATNQENAVQDTQSTRTSSRATLEHDPYNPPPEVRDKPLPPLPPNSQPPNQSWNKTKPDTSKPRPSDTELIAQARKGQQFKENGIHKPKNESAASEIYQEEIAAESKQESPAKTASPHEILGVSPNATQREIRQVFETKVKEAQKNDDIPLVRALLGAYSSMISRTPPNIPPNQPPQSAIRQQ